MRRISIPASGSFALACLLLCSAAWPLQPASPAVNQTAAAAALKRDSRRCSTQADIDACYDAIRWNPGDPALLVALADALLRANRPADALRNYQRAAALAPNTRGIAAKISAAEAKLKPKRAAVNPADHAGGGAAGRHYSNAAPEAQSH